MPSRSSTRAKEAREKEVVQPETPFKAWLKQNGGKEYEDYQKMEEASPHLSFDEWAASDKVAGAYLYYLALEAWESASDIESDSEDEEVNGHSEFSQPDGEAADTAIVKPAATPESAPRLSEPQNGVETRHSPSETLSTPAETPTKDTTTTTPAGTPPTEATNITPANGATKPDSAKATPTATPPQDDSQTPTPLRRGLRTRRPVQEKPYEYHAKVAQNQRRTKLLNASQKQQTPRGKKGRAGRASFPDLHSDEVGGEYGEDSVPGEA